MLLLCLPFSTHRRLQRQMAHLMQVRWNDKEGDLGMTHASIWVLLPSPILVAEPVRVVVLDCSGITFVDAAGAREVVQVRERIG